VNDTNGTLGLVNAILLISTRRLVDDSAGLPSVSTPRKVIDMSSAEAVGITPFVLTPEEESEVQQRVSMRQSLRPVVVRPSSSISDGTTPSFYSLDSFKPTYPSSNTYAVRR
jgi:hypothetical protein